MPDARPIGEAQCRSCGRATGAVLLVTLLVTQVVLDDEQARDPTQPWHYCVVGAEQCDGPEGSKAGRTLLPCGHSDARLLDVSTPASRIPRCGDVGPTALSPNGLRHETHEPADPPGRTGARRQFTSPRRGRRPVLGLGLSTAHRAIERRRAEGMSRPRCLPTNLTDCVSVLRSITVRAARRIDARHLEVTRARSSGGDRSRRDGKAGSSPAGGLGSVFHRRLSRFVRGIGGTHG